MSTLKINFFSNPFRWIFNYVIFNNLPLMWKIKVANTHMNFWKWKRETKDRLFGELTFCITWEGGWDTYHRNGVEVVCRNVCFHRYRKHTPWLRLSHTLVGVQFKNEEAFPFVGEWEHCVNTYVDVTKSINSINERTRANNLRREKHQKLKEALANPVEQYESTKII